MPPLEIQLENYPGNYCPGSTIIGRVVMSFSSPKNVREIRLKVRGEEHTEWTESESYTDSDGKSSDRSVTYSGTNRFYAVENTLAGAGEIGAGIHEYPFSITLPEQLPSSYKGIYGSIKYTIKATVDIPCKMNYREQKLVYVTVHTDLNLMDEEIQMTPVAYSEDKTVCCWCCSSGPITVAVHLQKEAFFVGETAKVTVEVTNLSNESIEKVKAKMIMTIVSTVTSPSSRSKSETELVAAARDSGVGAHGRRTYYFDLEIPPSTFIPNFYNCKLFKLKTAVKVTAVLPRCHRNMDVYAKAFLGHTPIGGSQDQYPGLGFQQNGNPCWPSIHNNQHPEVPPSYNVVAVSHTSKS